MEAGYLDIKAYNNILKYSKFSTKIFHYMCEIAHHNSSMLVIGASSNCSDRHQLWSKHSTVKYHFMSSIRYCHINTKISQLMSNKINIKNMYIPLFNKKVIHKSGLRCRKMVPYLQKTHNLKKMQKRNQQ